MADFTGVRQVEGTGEVLIHPDYKTSDPIALTLSILARMNNQPLLRKADADKLLASGWNKYKNPFIKKPF
jgi:hypothetical protein